MTMRLREVGKVLSRKNETALRNAVQAVIDVLAVAVPQTDNEEELAHNVETAVGEAAGLALHEPCDLCDRQPLAEAEVVEMESEPIPLLEARAIGPDGIVPIKVISPGWGATGYYDKDVLKRDGPNAYPAGTKMYWNHPTATEEAERPERDLRDLAAETVSAAHWVDAGPKGPGLYADAKVFGAYKESVEELAPHIGVSIKGNGHARMGEAEGRRGFIVESIDEGHSIDFVTQAGRGGEVLQLFEAAGRKAKALSESRQAQGENDVSEVELAEAQKRAEAAEARAVRAEEALAVTRAGTIVSELVAKSGLHALAQMRLNESLVQNLPVTDGGLDEKALTTRVEEAIKEETDYIAKVTGGATADPVTGMGASASISEAGGPATSTEDLTKAFVSLGLSESEAAIAAAGRTN